MKKTVLIFVMIILSVFVSSIVYAEKEKIEVAPGMELLKVGAVRVIVPKGTLYEDKGSKIEVEGIGEFVGRRFLETEERFLKVERNDERLEKEIKELKKVIDEMKEKELAKEKKENEEGKKIKP